MLTKYIQRSYVFCRISSRELLPILYQYIILIAVVIDFIYQALLIYLMVDTSSVIDYGIHDMTHLLFYPVMVNIVTVGIILSTVIIYYHWRNILNEIDDCCGLKELCIGIVILTSLLILFIIFLWLSYHGGKWWYLNVVNHDKINPDLIKAIGDPSSNFKYFYFTISLWLNIILCFIAIIVCVIVIIFAFLIFIYCPYLIYCGITNNELWPEVLGSLVILDLFSCLSLVTGRMVYNYLQYDIIYPWNMITILLLGAVTNILVVLVSSLITIFLIWFCSSLYNCSNKSAAVIIRNAEIQSVVTRL